MFYLNFQFSFLDIETSDTHTIRRRSTLLVDYVFPGRSSIIIIYRALYVIIICVRTMTYSRKIFILYKTYECNLLLLILRFRNARCSCSLLLGKLLEIFIIIYELNYYYNYTHNADGVLDGRCITKYWRTHNCTLQVGRERILSSSLICSGRKLITFRMYAYNHAVFVGRLPLAAAAQLRRPRRFNQFPGH